MMIKLTIVVTVRQLLFISAILALVDKVTFCLCSSPCLDLNFIFFASREIIQLVLQLVLPVALVIAFGIGFLCRFFWRI